MPDLCPDDQAKVDTFLVSNVNAVERAPFRPWRLLFIILCTLGVLTAISFWVAHDHGVV